MQIDLFRLVYCSRNSVDDHNPSVEIDDILVQSRDNNERCGVTGALLYSDGCFAQALEGPSKAVHATFERIQCDPRHRDVIVLQAKRAERRLFGSWSMTLASPIGTAAIDVALRQVLARQDDVAGAKVTALLADVIGSNTDWLAAAG